MWENINVPLFSAANWGGQGLHPRGNFEGFVRAASKDKWLEAHGIEHWTHFYTDYGRELQRKFFDHFLKGIDSGWSRQPRVLLQVRRLDRFVAREENEWPPARTQWTKFYLDPAEHSLQQTPGARRAGVSFDALGDGLTFLTPPLAQETEITGPSAAKLLVSSSTRDADVFLVLRVFSPDLNEVVFQGALDQLLGLGLGAGRIAAGIGGDEFDLAAGQRVARCSPGRSSSSMWKSGRLPSSFPPATASG